MFSYEALGIASYLMVFSVGYLLGDLLLKKFQSGSDKKFFKYARIVLLLLSTIMFIWLLFNKESFHWNYDIATGEPVDHYSTYGRCLAYTVIALVSNIIGGIVHFKKNTRQNQANSNSSNS